ncbi:LAGLIDADG family homing endonuclease [Clostridium coskatii]|uniref:Homing endonuclease LAGLIDADG domain-containing protein n=1 Tax=Clostridium coskatii TaxID=1705578 RepID=A0A162KSM6_9CLOT|nr:LAGLIDADG family homing endonuclease [Clostridium coskatii]OAA86344.1 hypothetical protein WX73_02838 [Clostridium coskatii]OAA86362.1 hypothetical protein WX73_02856 [Clostridium coskatii]OBR95071.1 hypothetical protein CLCOS_17760 [Clostridium coskatii]
MRNELHKEIINDYLNGESSIKISKALGISSKVIRQILKSNQISLRDIHERSQKYIHDENIFTSITNDAQAYWVGIFYSDGYVTKNYQVGLCVSTEDIEHLHKLNKFFKSNYHIYIYKPGKTSYSNNNYCRLLIKSKKIVDDLCRFGITTNEKNPTSIINDLSVPLKKGIIRGMFDGDGSIYYTIKKRKKKDYKEFAISYTGNLELVNFFKKFIEENNFATTRKIFKDTRAKDTYYIRIQGNRQLKNFLDFLYKDVNESCYLTRKYNIYRELCDFINNTTSFKTHF